MQFLNVSALLLSIAVAACGGSSGSATPSQPSAPAGSAAADPSCPVSVAGTSVTVEDTDNGAALVFVTTGDVAEVRRRVASLVAMHNDHHGKMGALPDAASTDQHVGHDMSGHAGHDMHGHAGHMSGHAEHGSADHGSHTGHAGGMIGVHSKAIAADVEGGAKATFVANASDVSKLQGELRIHAQHLGSGTCAMGSS